jgi:hypothetical protein
MSVLQRNDCRRCSRNLARAECDVGDCVACRDKRTQQYGSMQLATKRESRKSREEYDGFGTMLEEGIDSIDPKEVSSQGRIKGKGWGKDETGGRQLSTSAVAVAGDVAVELT